jgi:hypothetical protein
MELETMTKTAPRAEAQDQSTTLWSWVFAHMSRAVKLLQPRSRSDAARDVVATDGTRSADATDTEPMGRELQLPPPSFATV